MTQSTLENEEILAVGDLIMDRDSSDVGIVLRSKETITIMFTKHPKFDEITQEQWRCYWLPNGFRNWQI